MVAFTGTLASSCILPLSSGINAGAYDNRTLVAYPFGGWAAQLDNAGIETLHIPSIPAFADAGTHQRSFGDDWFNRIHISQGLLTLGNVISGVTQTIGLWNAWLTAPQTLNSLTATNADGISEVGPGNPPLTFAPNQQLNWTFTVSIDGPPTINASFVWVFSDGESVALAVSGSRVTAWALTPDWEHGVRETLQFKTDVMIAWSGAEMRRALRIAPRRVFEFQSPMQLQERRLIEAQLFAWSAMVWALPIFVDGQRLTSALAPGATTIPCDTVNRDFVAGGVAILIGADASAYEVVQITSFTGTALALTHAVVGTWPVGSRLYPARTARLTAYPKIARDNGEFATISLNFMTNEPCDWPAAVGLPQYRGYPVLEDSPDTSGNDQGSYERQAVTIDNETGVLEVDDTAQIGFVANTHAWFMNGRTPRALFRSLMYLLKGRQGELWVPTYQSDLKLVANIGVPDTSITVEATGYSLFLSGALNRQDIRIELLNGTIYYRRITGSAVLDQYTERLSLDSSLGAAITPAQIRRISYMSLSRLDSDNIIIDHINSDVGIATSSTPFRAVNHNV